MATLKNTTINDTGFLKLPNGNTVQRPVAPAAGMLRYNTDYNTIEYWNGTSWFGVGTLGSSPGTAAASATTLSNAGITTNGNYWLFINGVATEVYVNFTFAGGPYVLVMVAASTGTTYDYDSSVWTSSSGGVSTALNPNSDTNQVSTAFYNLSTTRTGLALYENSTSYFQYLDHASGTPQALSNGSAGVPGPTTPNGTTIAGNNIIPSLSPARALGWFNAITAAGYTAQTDGSTYYRYGYYHGIPEPTAFGYVRFGFSADLDSSDSRDRAIGMGIKNNGGGPVGFFTASAGRFDYTNGSSGPKNNLRGFLYVKN
jgi:hypothetical protein